MILDLRIWRQRWACFCNWARDGPGGKPLSSRGARGLRCFSSSAREGPGGGASWLPSAVQLVFVSTMSTAKATRTPREKERMSAPPRMSAASSNGSSADRAAIHEGFYEARYEKSAIGGR